MSRETYAALQDAIQAHVQDNGSDDLILTDWVLYSYSTSMSRANTGAYQRVGSDMPPHTLLGLIYRLQVDAAEEEEGA